MFLVRLLRRAGEDGYRRSMPVCRLRRYQGEDVYYPVCPRCGSTMEREYQSYCDRCGQRLSWDVPRHVMARS